MLKDIARGITGPVVERILSGAAQSWTQLPRPAGDPHVHAMGPDPDQILMLGSGAVRGVGVVSHDVGIGGYLARRLASLTGRGADVELLSEQGLTLARAEKLLRDVDLMRFDALVIMLGTREAISLRSERGWRRDILAFLTRLTQSAPPTLSIFVVGVAPLPALIGLGGVMASVVRSQMNQLDQATAEACEATGASYIPFDPVTDRETLGHMATYAAWAEPIALHMHEWLDAAVEVPHIPSPDEARRQASLDAMGILDTAPSAELNALAKVAKNLFGVAGASVNLIDRDRLHMKASQGFEAVDAPRSGSFCSVTIENDGILVLEDTRKDARFSSTPSVQDGIHFYAGYPIEAPNGQRIGTLCLFDTQPRGFTNADESLLRELALRVQAELWSTQSTIIR